MSENTASEQTEASVEPETAAEKAPVTEADILRQRDELAQSVAELAAAFSPQELARTATAEARLVAAQARAGAQEKLEQGVQAAGAKAHVWADQAEKRFAECVSRVRATYDRAREGDTDAMIVLALGAGATLIVGGTLLKVAAHMRR